MRSKWCAVQYLPLISPVLYPYWNFFLSIYGPSTKRADRQKKKNEKKQEQQQKKRGTRSDVCSMASRLGDRKGPETTAGHVAGRTIWQSFDRRQKKKVLLVHENINT